jgi:hypothetical protein
MSHQFDAIMHRLERVERFLETLIARLGHPTHCPPPPDCGVSIGGSAHRPHPRHDEQAFFISAHNPR